GCAVLAATAADRAADRAAGDRDGAGRAVLPAADARAVLLPGRRHDDRRRVLPPTVLAGGARRVGVLADVLLPVPVADHAGAIAAGRLRRVPRRDRHARGVRARADHAGQSMAP